MKLMSDKNLLKNNLTSFISIFILLATCAFLAFKNYTPGTWLIGWDNFMPEFNFALNIKRSIFAVWQEFQGLGLLGGMGHASDLIRQLFLLFLSIFVKKQLLGYIYQFLMLIIGPLGVYILIKNVFLKEFPEKGKELSALLGGLFYLLNLATLQTFFTPIPMFTTQYGFLPYLLMYCLLYLKENKRRHLYLFALFTLFSTPMAYTPTIFFSYLSVLFIIFLFFVLENMTRASILRVLKLLSVIFLINAYWLLPFGYFTLNKSEDVLNAKINRMASEDGFLKNKEFGHLKDIALLKGFWFEFVERQPNGKFDYLMPVWRDYLDGTFAEKIGYLLFGVILLGIAHALYRKLNYAKTFFIIFLFSLFILMTENPPLGFLFKFLRDHIIQFREALRFPFTKYSIISALLYSMFFSSGIYLIYTHLQRAFKKLTDIFVLILFATILVIFMLPAFKGQLVSPLLRIQVPKEYFDLFEFFSKQDKDKRIANFPQHTFWEWRYYNWGYLGSGFLWYGIEQPILDRSFDVWSSFNEAYFEEMTYAIYSQNLPAFEKLLEKYQIDYLLLDKNVASFTDEGVLFYPQLENLFNNSKKIEKVTEFKDLKVYKTQLSYETANFVYSHKAKNIGPAYKKAYYDQAFMSEGVYYTDIKGIDEILLFRSFSHIPETSSSWFIKETDGGTSLAVKAPHRDKGWTLEIPAFTESEELVPATISLNGDILNLNYKTPTILINEGTITRKNSDEFKLNTFAQDILGWGLNGKYYGKEPEVKLSTRKHNQLKIYLTKENLHKDISPNIFSQHIQRCGQEAANQYYEKSLKDNILELTAKKTRACVFVNLALMLESKKGELLKVSFDYKSASDEKPFFCLYNPGINDCLNNKKSTLYSPSKDWKNYEEYLEIGEEDTATLWLQLILDAEFSEALKSISYRNFFIATYPPISEIVITKEYMQSLIGGEVRLSADAVGEIALALDKPFEDSTMEIKEGALNCDNFNSKYFLKEILKDSYGKNYIRYSSENAVSCDHFDYSKLPHNYSYLLLLETKNISGRPLTVCLENMSSRRCDLEELLSSSKDWEKNYFIIPPRDQLKPGDPSKNSGHVLHVYNRSVGNVRTINELKEIQFYYLPFHYLKNITLKNSKPAKKPIEEAQIIKVIKYSPFLYRINIDSSQKSLIILNQTFEKGWLLLDDPHFLSEHVLVNNWANGWLVPLGKKTLIALYAPALLEFIGFFLFLLSPVALFKNLTTQDN